VRVSPAAWGLPTLNAPTDARPPEPAPIHRGPYVPEPTLSGAQHRRRGSPPRVSLASYFAAAIPLRPRRTWYTPIGSGSATKSANPAGRSSENGPRMHHHIGMRRGQKGGQKAPIRRKFRQKSEKKSKKAPDSALPILTFRASNPLGAGARADLASKLGRNPPKPTQNRPPTYRPCAMRPTSRERLRERPAGGGLRKREWRLRRRRSGNRFGHTAGCERAGRTARVGRGRCRAIRCR